MLHFRVGICFIGLLILISTLRESWMRTVLGPRQNTQKVLNDQNVLHTRVLHCFSAIRNAKYLISTDTFADDIHCLHGIRVLTFFLTIMVHLKIEIFLQPQYNKDFAIQVNILYVFHIKPYTN